MKLKRSNKLVGKNPSSTKGLKEGLTRATFVVQKWHLEYLKQISEGSKLPLKDVVEFAFDCFLSNEQVVSDLEAETRHLQNTVGVEEVAKKLGVSPVTVRNKIKRGEIEAFKVGGDYLIPQKSGEIV